MSKEVEKYADESMFTAEPITTVTPRVVLVNATRDPLGQIAALAKAYQGKFVDDLKEINDEDREYYLRDVQKNKLGMPLEGVQLHFRISGVTRGFTHQLVRQRMGAAYSQESMRFAVKEDFPVAVPTSIADADPGEWQSNYNEGFQLALSQRLGDDDNSARRETEASAREWAERHTSVAGKQRKIFDDSVRELSAAYNTLIAMGMPAEDARALAPTSIQTQINYVTSLRGLMDHAGLRLCTQAQFEWKQVWNQILSAIRAYGRRDNFYYVLNENVKPGVVFERIGTSKGTSILEVMEEWQWDEISNLFKPICYKTGKCEFMSDFDRYCPIRDQVEAFHSHGIPSSEWEKGATVEQSDHVNVIPLELPAIRPAQWLDPKAAIQKDGSWRSTQAQENIRYRR